MGNAAMIYPMAALAVLTLAVMGALIIMRMRLVVGGVVDAAYFEVQEGTPPPPAHTRLSRHFSNMFEMPVLFYAAALTVIAMAAADAIFVAMAWAYVAMRVVHLGVHTTYNNIQHRVAAYVIGNLVLLAFWARLVITAG